MEYLATHLHNTVRDNPSPILVAAGDLIGASPLISGLFHDPPTIEAVNAMNLGVTTIRKSRAGSWTSRTAHHNPGWLSAGRELQRWREIRRCSLPISGGECGENANG